MLRRFLRFCRKSDNFTRINNSVTSYISICSAQFFAALQFASGNTTSSRLPHRTITVPRQSRSMNHTSLQTDLTESSSGVIWVRLQDICNALDIDSALAADVRTKVEAHYNEPHRAYHNLTHINALLTLSATYRERIHDSVAVDLAIIFHDIIYNPKSKTNEEDSAALFTSLFANKIDPHLLEMVNYYIIETKKHAVQDSADEDLKLFIDLDMSILGVNRLAYLKYARQVRKEYEFVPEADYCRGRSAVLQSFLSGGAIYATVEGKARWEAQARENIAWECAVLSSGRLV